MSEFVHKEMTGSLFRNEWKTRENQPDWKGRVMIGGVEMEIAAWTKQGKGGEFFSLKISPARERGETRNPPAEPSKAPVWGYPTHKPVNDEEIPF